MFKAFFKDSLIYMIPSFLTRGLSIILVPLYTRVLSPADYGSLDLLLVFAALINLTVAFEISQGLARFYTGKQDIEQKKAYVSTALWFTIGCYSLFSLVAIIYNHQLSLMVMSREGFESVFLIGVAYIWVNGIFSLIHNQFRWDLRSKKFVETSLISTFTSIAISVWLAYFMSWGIEGLLYGMLAGASIGCAYGVWHLRQTFQPQFDTEKLKRMLFFSAPLIPSGIAVFLSMYIDRLMINHFLSIDDVGMYGIAFRLAGTVGLVMIGFGSALTPLIYKHYREKDTPRQMANIFRTFIVMALIAYLFLSLFSQEILYLLTTPSYYSAAPLVIMLVPAILLSRMYIFAPGTSIANKTHIILWINIMGAILNVIFNWIFIPLIGLQGAAVGTLLGYSCVFSTYMIFSQRYYPVPHRWLPITSAIIAISILAWGIPLIVLSPSATILLKVVTLALGCAIIVFVRVIHLPELIQALMLVRQKMLILKG
jgi:O-antigen/teichoic acid export membrane protein